MQRSKKTSKKTTHRSEWRSVLKKDLTGPTLLEMSGNPTTHPLDRVRVFLRKIQRANLVYWADATRFEAAVFIRFSRDRTCWSRKRTAIVRSLKTLASGPIALLVSHVGPEVLR